MRLSEITISNFRGIRSLHIPLDSLTVLIGENNAGKSTVLEAIRFVITKAFSQKKRSQFGEYDFHLVDGAATPQTADPINITLHFVEEHEDEWPDTLIQQLNEVVQLDANGLYHICLQTEGRLDVGTSTFEAKWSFLDLAGTELILKNSVPLNLISKFVPLFFLSALRDASQEFGQRGQFWSGFLKSITLPDDKREELEEALREINATVIGANIGLNQVTNQIASAKSFVPLNATDPVVLEAIPTRVFDMVGKIQVHLKSISGAKLPLYRHGEGTQSVAVLMLFQAFVAANLAETFALESTPILALEEPETHLHPCAIRSLGSSLTGLPGQTIVSTHSGDLLSRVPINSIRRLYKHGGETKIGRLPENILSAREIQAINYHICLTRGYYLFSRCWLLVEGESDFHIMPLLFELLGNSPDDVSFSVLEFSQVFGKGESFIKFAKSLGIEWFMMADGDAAGLDYVTRASAHLDPGEALADRALRLNHLDIEHEFWHNGFDGFIRGHVDAATQTQVTQQSSGNVDIERKGLIKAAIASAGGKPAFAQILANEVQQRGNTSIPQSISNVVAKVVNLAGN